MKNSQLASARRHTLLLMHSFFRLFCATSSSLSLLSFLVDYLLNLLPIHSNSICLPLTRLGASTSLARKVHLNKNLIARLRS